MQGPTLPISEEVHASKYRLPDESFEQCVYRLAGTLRDGNDHWRAIKDIFGDMRFLPGGRVQNAIGSPRSTTAFNCFVSGTIEDSMGSIMTRATEASETMRRGGGVGYDFSRLRPRGELISTLGSRSSGPVSFMNIYDAVCQTISSAGHRRGAQMGVMRIDHPDIEQFIMAKQRKGVLEGFNVSIGVTDEFMRCLEAGEKFPLRWGGKTYTEVDPQALWDMIMRSTWDYAEPGVLFLDTINYYNNLYYCETIEATNPCGEQPLPPNGACLLGSFNLVKYLSPATEFSHGYRFNSSRFEADVFHIVRAMDNVIDRTVYPLPAQEKEAKAKRRMGLGVTGLANAGEILGMSYGSPEFLTFTDEMLQRLANYAYQASTELAREKGAFPAYDPKFYLDSNFVRRLDDATLALIDRHGIRNSHLTSIAPTGTISITADNVSSGIEPPFRLSYERTMQAWDGPTVEEVSDYAYRVHGVKGRTANELSANEHLSVIAAAQKWVDSAVSKTCNVGANVSFDEFRDLYHNAWKLGCKGLTTFRDNGKRKGILKAKEKDDNSFEKALDEAIKVQACTYDPATGTRTCDA